MRHGFGEVDELDHFEEGGCLADADADLVSLARATILPRCSTVAKIYDEDVAAAFGLRRDQITVMIHNGSRGLGHAGVSGPSQGHGPGVPDRQLCCAPIDSPEGRACLGAMAAAANFAFANRQVMAHRVRESIATVPAAG